jgi:hypothetical protein
MMSFNIGLSLRILDAEAEAEAAPGRLFGQRVDCLGEKTASLMPLGKSMSRTKPPPSSWRAVD